ncbi:hypothetical protein TNCV_1996511 [Trichonephila clavipes]|uniref:Uncharacterized protein n=1 Tax=Trichonephila clavipes TaxID=2585209 RepID=A0A8X6RQI7_TRICX|nr:hypothetical protein TNCV_1996511 [Trichonephila clavipes]
MSSKALHPRVGDTAFSEQELPNLVNLVQSLGRILTNPTEFPADYFLGFLHLKTPLLMQHYFQMVGYVINQQPPED